MSTQQPTIIYTLTDEAPRLATDRKSTRLNSSHTVISYAVFCLKKKNKSQVPYVLAPHRGKFTLSSKCRSSSCYHSQIDGRPISGKDTASQSQRRLSDQ